MVDSLDSGDVTKSLGRPRQLELTEQSTGKGRTAQRENPEDLQKIPFKYSAKYSISTGM